MSTTDSASFDIGRVVSRTFSVIGRNWITFLVLSVLAVVPQSVWSFYTTRGALDGGAAFALSGSFWLFTFVGWLVTIVATFVLQASLTYGTIMDLNGQRASLGESLAVGLRAFLPLFAIGILYTLGIGLGFVLLLVPGLMLITIWAVVVPARIAENTGVMQSFSRSQELTRGYRWPIFGIFVVFYVIIVIVEFVTRPLFGLGMLSQASALAAVPLYFVLTGVIHVFTSVIASAGVACIYYELRTVKEGIGPQQLAAVFE
jgi:hypothetical protein